MVKIDGCLDFLLGRNGGDVKSLPEKIFEGRMIHITALILGVCTVIGAVAGVISLVLYIHDRKKK
ncbi:MAG: hypothetical protein J6B23_00600 [Clostridia bacterium]|nr:hypothetical protein [Clostridia bacterium]